MVAFTMTRWTKGFKSSKKGLTGIKGASRLEDFNLRLLWLKSDGATLYITRDIAMPSAGLALTTLSKWCLCCRSRAGAAPLQTAQDGLWLERWHDSRWLRLVTKNRQKLLHNAKDISRNPTLQLSVTEPIEAVKPRFGRQGRLLLVQLG